ncbi:hypothetical protein CSA37_00085 [Candidatus Fermentibacteria bacterium]|nr:MAG: hypothetical protein CSA37_00085 [Candidatus Fermentibacteria bacterium]
MFSTPENLFSQGLFASCSESGKLDPMTGKKFYSVLLAVLLAAVLVRVFIILRNPIPAGDGMASHVLLADNLRQGKGFNTFVKWNLYDTSREFLRAEANRQPAMAFLIMPVFAVFGTGFLQAQAVALICGILAILTATFWARKLFGDQAALLTAAFLAFDPPFVWFSTQPDSLMLYITLFYLILMFGGSNTVSWKKSALLGLMTGLLYLTRTQGALMGPAAGLWVLLGGGRKKWLKALVFSTVTLLVISPWLIRNMNEFGSPSYSQNGQFLLNENHWSAWSVRETPPSPGDMLQNQGPAAVAGYVGAGILRVLEPFTTGSTHSGEVFGQPTLAVFVVFGMYAMFCRDTGKRLLFPAIAVVPVMAALVLHQHSGRYMSVAVPLAAAAGSAGIVRVISEPGRRRMLPWILGLIVLTLAAPFINILRQDSRARASEAMEAAEWIRDNASDSAWVCTYPNTELYHFIYRKPTLAWPNDYEMLLWPYLYNHGVQYMVVDRDLPVLRPWLSRCFRRTPDGTAWDVLNPPPFLAEVWRTQSGNTIVYRFTGPVPEGYMAVDSLPPDNFRAIGPH